MGEGIFYAVRFESPPQGFATRRQCIIPEFGDTRLDPTVVRSRHLQSVLACSVLCREKSCRHLALGWSQEKCGKHTAKAKQLETLRRTGPTGAIITKTKSFATATWIVFLAFEDLQRVHGVKRKCGRGNGAPGPGGPGVLRLAGHCSDSTVTTRFLRCNGHPNCRATFSAANVFLVPSLFKPQGGFG